MSASRSETPLRIFAYGLIIGLVAGALSLWLVRDRSSSQQEQDLRNALQDVTGQLQVVRSVADSLVHEDSLRVLASTAARDSVAVHRPAVDSAIAQVEQLAPRGVTAHDDLPPGSIEGPLTTPRAWLVISDTAWNVPLPVARVTASAFTAIAQMKPQLLRLETALHEDSLAMRTKDSRIATLVTADSLAQHQDSLHRALEGNLTTQRDGAFRRGLHAGVKWTLATVTVVTAVIVIGSRLTPE